MKGAFLAQQNANQQTNDQILRTATLAKHIVNPTTPVKFFGVSLCQIKANPLKT
jgi:hypothetical protein